MNCGRHSDTSTLTNTHTTFYTDTHHSIITSDLLFCPRPNVQLKGFMLATIKDWLLTNSQHFCVCAHCVCVCVCVSMCACVHVRACVRVCALCVALGSSLDVHPCEAYFAFPASLPVRPVGPEEHLWKRWDEAYEDDDYDDDEDAGWDESFN